MTDLEEALASCVWPRCELAKAGLKHDVKVGGLPFCTDHAQEAISLVLLDEPKETP